MADARTGRNLGIDALRVLSMLMVVLLHVLGKGGVLAAVPAQSIRGTAAWTLEIASYCAVDCFAIITGYVMLRSRPRYGKLLLLWVPVVFFDALSLLASFVAGDGVSVEQVVWALFPVSNRVFWYFTDYSCLFLFVPFINRVLKTLEDGQWKLLCGLLLTLFSLIPTVFSYDGFRLSLGYHVLWLTTMYVVGAYIRFRREERLSIPLAGLPAVGAYVAAVVLTVVSHELALPVDLVQYVSPTVVVCAVSLFLAFEGLAVPGEGVLGRVVAGLSGSAFFVYIIHSEPFLWSRIDGAFASYAGMSAPVLMACAFLTAVAIFMGCVVLDKLRVAAFGALGLDARLKKASDSLSTLVCKRFGM